MTPLRKALTVMLATLLALAVVSPAQAAQVYSATLIVNETAVPQSPYWDDDGGTATAGGVATCYKDDDGNKASTFTLALYARVPGRAGAWEVRHVADRTIACGVVSANFGSVGSNGTHFLKVRSQNGNGWSSVALQFRVS